VATTAQIVITVDSTGAVTELNNLSAAVKGVDPSLQKIGKTGNLVMTGLAKDHQHALDSVRLLNEGIGIGIPRALQNVIAKSPAVAAALAGAFSGVAIASFAAIALTALEDVIEKVITFRDTAKRAFLEIQKEARGQELSMLESGLAQNRDLRVRTEIATANELVKLQLQYHAQREALIEQELKAEELARLTGETDIVTLANKNLLQLDKAYAAERKMLLLKAAGDVRSAKDAEVAASKLGLDRIIADEHTALDDIRDKVNEGSMLRVVAEAKRAQIHAETNAKIREFDRARLEFTRSTAANEANALLQAAASTASGRQQIELQYEAKIAEIRTKELAIEAQLAKEGITEEIRLDGERTAAKLEENNKLVDLARQRAEEETQINSEAAIAMLPPWQRADAQLVADAEARIKKIRDMEVKDNTFRVQGEREVSSILQKEWHDRVESMANQLEGLYNEITTGGIKQFFMQQFKHMVFEMVASWILGMQQMKGASQQTMNGGGGILGSIFGSLGLGGIFGGGGGGQGGIGSLPGVITNFGGGSVGIGGDRGFMGLGGGNGDFGGETGGGGGGGGLASSLFGSLGLSAGRGAGAGTTLPSGAGPGGGLAGGIGGALGPLLAKVFPNGLKIGGTTISGAALATVGIALVSDAFRKGGFLRGLEGAAGGAMTGFAIGGPIGAIIGGIAGFILGIWGKSTKQARLQIEANIKTQAATIEDSYNLFQSDWTTSRTALEALRQQGVDALKQAGVKDISRSRVGHVDQWIDKAEKEIDATQAERNRRNALSFGPAQFRVGGFVGAGAGGAIPSWFAGTAMHFADGGAVPAILHEGEFVMRPEAVSRIGPGKLANMNSGGSGGGDTNITIQAIDAKSFEEFLNRNGGVKILKFFVRARNEGMW
jgi:hypothetical protein